jgi:protein involved in polysaccharide export with SLBB domain
MARVFALLVLSFVGCAPIGPNVLAVIGGVAHPGYVSVRPRMTIAEVIEAAGGLTPTAPHDVALVRRGAEGAQTYRLALDRTDATFTVAPGDCVFVRDAFDP